MIVGGWWLRVVHRDRASLRSGIDAWTHVRVDLHPAGIREPLDRRQGAHVRGVAYRMQLAGTAAAQIADGYDQLDQRIATLEAWVGHWSGQGTR
jgi:hypothetical protein